MRYVKVKLCAVLLLVLGPAGVQAQEAVPAAGGNAAGSGGSAGYTVGQAAYTTNTGTGGTVTQGVQQTFDISVIIGIEKAKGISLEYSVSPNPAADYLKLKVEGYTADNLSYQLYDMKGKLLQDKKVAGNASDISIENLVPATYFLKVIDKQKEIKIFKIIKNGGK